MALNLFIIGPSGCGKSTQAKLISEKYGLTHFSTGQIFRDEIATGSALGLEAKKYIDQGQFCPDEILIPIVESALKTVNYQNFIIDGTPRRLNQAVLIQKILQEHNQDISCIILLSVTFEEIMARRQRLGESFQDAARTDLSAEAVASRQKSFNDTITPIIGNYQQSGKLAIIDGNRTVEPVFADIVAEIEKVK